jgi:hypothetical protein
VTSPGTADRGQPGRDEPEDIRTPTRSARAATAREKAHGTPSAHRRAASNVGIHADARPSARRTRQSPDFACGRSRPSVCAFAGAPAVPAIVAESVPCLATTAAGVCAGRSVVLSAHVTPSTHSSRDPNDQGDGDHGRVPARPDQHARGPRAATRQGVGILSLLTNRLLLSALMLSARPVLTRELHCRLHTKGIRPVPARLQDEREHCVIRRVEERKRDERRRRVRQAEDDGQDRGRPEGRER